MTAYKYFNKEFKTKSLIKTYEKYIKEGSAVGIDKIGRDKFEDDHAEQIEIIRRKVTNNTYKFTPYKKKLISKGEDKPPRVISIPTFRDRVTLRALCNILSSTYKNDLSIEIPQAKIESINRNIKDPNYESYIKIDVSNFYPTINHAVLLKTLRKKIRKPQLLQLIEKSIKNKIVNKSGHEQDKGNSCGVPQGLSISNVLAEIYLLDLDEKYNQYNDISYTRYVDDILIFCKDSIVENVFFEIKRSFEKVHLEIHSLNTEGSKCQSGSITDEIHFLGYKYINRKPTLTEKNKEKFQDSIANLLTTFKYRYEQATDQKSRNRCIDVLEWRLNLKITGCIFDNNKRGWMFYFSQIEDLTILYRIDATIAKLVYRFCLVPITVKTLVKTFHESKRLKTNSHKYITNFDILSTDEKREILERYLGSNRLAKFDQETINRFFNMKITYIIQELERDIGNIS